MFADQELDDFERDFAEAQKNDSPAYRPPGKEDAEPEKEDLFADGTYDSQAEEMKRDQKAEEEESEEEDPEEETEDEESEEESEETDEEEEESEAEDDEEEKPPIRKGKGPQYISQEQFFATQRKTNKVLENIAQRLEAIQTGDLTQKQEDKSVEEIQRLAKEAGVSEEALPKFIEALQKQVLAPMQPVIAEIEQQKFVAAEAANDEKEWSEVVPDIQERYPNATPAQLQKAREVMMTLAHSTKYGFSDANHPPMPLDYILFKEQSKFQEIFKAKKKTFESGSRGPSERGDDEPKGRAYERKSPDQYTSKDIEQMEADFNAAVGESDNLVINRDGKKIKVK